MASDDKGADDGSEGPGLVSWNTSIYLAFGIFYWNNFAYLLKGLKQLDIQSITDSINQSIVDGKWQSRF